VPPNVLELLLGSRVPARKKAHPASLRSPATVRWTSA
jgi:hypothetical protein